ncbi:hypothetical protein [Maricaulis sp.]|uniref:hypothetical protein n=1 Tax=Maricaulis sp. TaxID=1486257 RepID=UPI0025BD86B7|nr:hypothetical protein [Maricaulis sp.]
MAHIGQEGRLGLFGLARFFQHTPGRAGECHDTGQAEQRRGRQQDETGDPLCLFRVGRG